MNRIYSLVYNVTLGQVQVASELAGGAVVSTRPQQRAGWRRQVMALAVGLLVAGGGLAQTLPSGGVVASGTVTIGPVSGSRLDISQASNKAVINWGSFGIGANDTVAFTTPGASAVTLNIVGANGGISQIDGTLSSNGHVFLLNQNGVLFGDTARVNVAGLVASAAGYTYDGSLHEQGTYLFDATGQTSAVTVAAGAVLTAAGPIILLGSKVTNNGTIQSTAGAVNLFGSEVVNNGSIAADAGIITLQAGTAATLDYSGESSPVLVDGSVLQAGQGAIRNTGSLQAVDIHIRSPYQASAINVGGVVIAGNLLELSQGGGGMTLGGSLSSVDEVSINSGSGSVTQTVGSLAAHELLLATEGGGQATPPAFNAARSVSLSSTANAISSISGDVAGNFKVVNTAANGRLDQLSVAGELDLYATATVTLSNVAAGTMKASAGALRVTGGVVGGRADLTARNAALAIHDLEVGGDLQAKGVGLDQTGSFTVGGDADLNAGTAALSLHNASVDGDLTATGSDITQTGSLAVGGTADLDSPGAIALANVNAGALDVTTGNQLQIAGGNVTGHAGLSAATSMTLTNLGAGGIIAAADALGASGLTVGTNATLTSRAAALSLDNVAVGGNLQANGVGMTQTGTLDVEGHATLLAGTGGLAIHNASAGGLTATGASITQTGTLTVIGVAKLDSAGDIGLANVATETLKVTAGDALTITGAQLSGNADLAAGSAMTLNNVNASSLVAKSNALSVTGGVVVGAAHLDAKNTTLLIDGFTTQGGLLAVGNGITQTGRLDVGGYASLEAGSGDVAIHNVTAGSHLIVSGASITQTGTASVAGRAELDTSGAITLADVDAAALTATADDTLQIAKANVTGHAALTANNTMTLGNVNAGSLTAASNALSLSTGVIDGAANLAARGTLQLTDSLSVGGELTATGVGINQIGTLHVDGDATLEAGNGNLVINNLTVGQKLAATGAGISQSGTLLVTGMADLDSTGAIALANVTAAALDASSGDQLQLDGATVSGDVVLAAAGEMHLTGVSADGVTATSNGLAISGLQVGRNANLDAGSSTLGIDGLAVGGDLLARGEGMSQQGSFHVVGNATLDAGTAALSLHNATVDGDLTAAGSAITQTGALAVGGTADLESTGAIALANVTADVLDVSAGDQLQIHGGTVTGHAGLSAATSIALSNLGVGSITAAADALSASGLTVGTNAALTSHTAALSLENVAVGGKLQASGLGLRQTGMLDVGGDAALDAGTGALFLNDVIVGGNLQANGVGLHQTGTLDVDGDADLDAGMAALSLNNVAVGGNLQANGVGLHQTGTLDVGGDADLNAGTAGLSLNNAIVDGDLSASGSAITQTGSLAVGGTVDLDSPGSINLRDVTARSLDITSGEQLQIAGANVAGGATLGVAGELKLADMFVGGQLRAAASAISQSGALSVGRSSELQAAGRIVLDHAGNQFTGPVALRAQQASIVSAAGLELASVDVTDLQARAGGQLAVGTANIAGVAHLSGNGVLLGAVTVGSDLQVDSAAGIAQQAALQVHGDTLLSAGGVIALEHAGNDFVGGVAAQGASIRLVDRNALDLQALGNHGGSGEIHVLAAGDLGVAGQGVDAGTGNLSLQSVGGRIVQSAGQVVAGHLQVAALGAVDLQGDNRIAALGDVSADGLKLVSHGGLRVSGNVQAGSDAMLEVRGGSLQLDGQLSSSQLRLLSEGNIVQGSSSLLQADTLSGRSGGSTVLGTGAGFVANQVAMLGDFSAAGGFSLTNVRSLSLGALNGSAFSINSGVSDLFLKVDGGDLLQSGQVPVLAGMSYWWSSGRIGTLLDPIRLVTSTGILQVDYVGAPPAYFHATTPAGVPVVVTGGVNALSFDVVAREQAGAMWRQPPLGLPAGGEQAAPIRLDGPGMALPAKPATACAASTADTLCMQ